MPRMELISQKRRVDSATLLEYVVGRDDDSCVASSIKVKVT